MSAADLAKGRSVAGCFRLGLIGYPLGHSRSPRLHEAALKAAGLEGSYQLFAIPPGDEGRGAMDEVIARLRSGDLHGLNVTIPHKQVVMGYVDHLSAVAAAVGAVNTLYLDSQGRLNGENYDVPGFLTDLQRLTGPSSGSALVLGAGGSARAVVYALSQAGWRVQVLARHAEQAAELVAAVCLSAESAGRCASGVLEHEVLKQARRGCDLLVNTTPLGMHPNISGCPWPEDVPLPEGAVVYDLVYNPAETLLVRRARAAGLTAESGAGMLVGQAALAFARWTGLEPPFDIMRQAFDAV